jgi:uncharacterized membrane protein YedE/YeeE
VDLVRQCDESNTFIPALAYTFAANPTEINVKHEERFAGESKYSLYQLIRLNFDLVTGFSVMPLQIFSILGMLLAMAAGSLFIYLLVRRFVLGAEVEGVFTLFALTFFLIGVMLFGLGLLLSGMTDPGKVIGFLDVAGRWDPSLAFVMGGAVAVGFFAFSLARRRTTAFLGGAMSLPSARQIDTRLVVGALIFGAGWGLAGFCPGPALVSMAAGQFKALLFVAAMIAGMVLFALVDRRFRHA